ncbi:TetR/AcrR family transcriptional regulator [Pseudooceanicola sp. HF7]|uniref:TetR/AcrR family transcriptional regulator n=1 Tax=Pseudooceanicola sp. HF7 TaxID=2721560 RepID=UPI001431F6DF|nr:TetR/AcrR family transcriptional regulator [Pseudooceanicola sp. HF7]NIZ11136.1 TetR/AcrR family transcriptional regulator [Pseudooceanicola sp. HF7]
MTRCILQKRRGRKLDQVLDGAREVFLRDGFEGANVDDIARAASVSKATLYSYFPDKRLLFLEVARQEFRRQADSAGCIVQPDLPPRDMLEHAAKRMVDFFTNPMSVSTYRLCVSEAERFPDLARDFYEHGPLLAEKMLCLYFEKAVERGELVIEDHSMAAHQFFELCKAEIFASQLFCPDIKISAERARQVAHEAVETFLARYGSGASLRTAAE